MRKGKRVNKEIFLENLPKYKEGRNKGGVIWKKCVGYKVKFIYNEIEGEIEILEIIKEANGNKKIKMKYLDSIAFVYVSGFIKCNIGKQFDLNKRFKYRYAIGDQIKTSTGKIKITKLIKIDKKDGSVTRKGYEYQCLNDGYVGEIFEYSLIDGAGCPVCCNKKIIKGINDIATTHPHLVKYFIDEEDSYKYSYGSEVKVLLKCPNCNFQKYDYIKSITSEYGNGFVCPLCSDGISYPEKFLANMLNQLHIEFLTQQMFDWARNIKHENPKLSGDKRYDFYIPSLNIIIEAHGEQHYTKNFSIGKNISKSLQEEQENDKIKEQLAKDNEVYDYIVIDCRRATYKWIKNHIVDSKLESIFDLSKIDWKKCGEYASNSLIKTVCNMWEAGIKSTQEISEQIGVERHTVQRYLKEGVELGWCSYNAIEAKKLSGSKSGKASGKKVLLLELNKIFYSCADLSRQSEDLVGVKLTTSCITDVCNGKTKHHKGYHFKYV